jgi:hypothetical protein
VPFQVILDTCVLVQLPLRDTLLSCAAHGMYVPKWSERSLDSVQRVLVDELGLSPEQARSSRRAIDDAFEDGTVPAARVDELVPAMRNPVHDRHVLAAAAAVNAAKIVTANVKDFPAHACEPHGVEALTPDEFLLDLLMIHGDGLLSVLERQAARLRRPALTVDEVLDRLEVPAPRFVDALRGQGGVQ